MQVEIGVSQNWGVGAFLGVPIIRIIGFWGSILGSPYFGKLPNEHGMKLLFTYRILKVQGPGLKV